MADPLMGSLDADASDIPLPLLAGDCEMTDHFGSGERTPPTKQSQGTRGGRVLPPGSDVGFSPRQIVISDSQDSISSTLSEKAERISDDEEFCIIDNPGLGIAVSRMKYDL